MSKSSRAHTSEEFGKPGSSALSGMDAPMIGAAASIFTDALTEQESGATPSPPAITVRMVVIALVVMFAFGAAYFALAVVPQQGQPAPAFSFSYASDGTGEITGLLDGPGQDTIRVSNGDDSLTPSGTLLPELRYNASTRMTVDGQTRSIARIYDFSGWPIRVMYVRVKGSGRPLATAIEISMPD